MKKGLLAAVALIVIALALVFIFMGDQEGNPRRNKLSGVSVTQTRELQSFNKLSASAGIDVYLIKSDSLYSEVSADQNLIDKVVTNVSNGKLTISYKNDFTTILKNMLGKTTVRVYTPDINIFVIEANSEADLTIGDGFIGESIQIDATSAADVAGSCNYNNVVIVATSGADIDISGECTKVVIDSSSGADVDTSELYCVDAEVSATSGADVSIRISRELNATASSGGNIVYYGNPHVTTKNSSSGGSVKQG